MMNYNQISECCRRGIIKTVKREYPLGGTTWYELRAFDQCECCGLEVDDPVAVTECCGEEVCTCELEELRTELAKKAEALGTTHADVIAVSQKIDALHNEINRSMKTG